MGSLDSRRAFGQLWFVAIVAAGLIGCGSVASSNHPDAGSGGGGGSGGSGGAGGGGGGGGGTGGGSGQDGGGGAGGTGGGATDGSADLIGYAGSDGPQTTAVTAISLDDINVFAAAAGTATLVPYIKKLYDDRNEYDTSTSRFTATDAGDYKICASLYSSTYAGSFRLRLYVNGSNVAGFGIDGNGNGFEHGCRVARLAAGDYVQVYVLQGSGAAVMFGQNTYWNWMTVAKISSTLDVSNITAFQAASGSFTVVPYATPRYDDKSQYDASTSKFTAAQAGDYELCASLNADTDTTHAFELDLFVNGAREDAFGGGGSFIAAQGCRTVRLAAGNYVQVEVYQSSGAPMAFAADSLTNWMTVAQMPSTLSLDNATTFTGAGSTFIKVPYGTELYDDLNQYSASMSRFTAAQAGDYQLCASMLGATAFEMDLYINGTRENALAGGSGDSGFSHGCRTVRLAAGDYVEIWADAASTTGTVTYSPNTYWDWLVVSKMR